MIWLGTLTPTAPMALRHEQISQRSALYGKQRRPWA